MDMNRNTGEEEKKSYRKPGQDWKSVLVRLNPDDILRLNKVIEQYKAATGRKPTQSLVVSLALQVLEREQQRGQVTRHEEAWGI